MTEKDAGKTGSENSPIEIWFEFASNYSYLSVMRIEALAADANCDVVWRPFLLGPIFKSFGWESSPFVLQKEKGDYMWQDMRRECAKYGLPWKKPSLFPRASILPMRVAAYGAREAWIGTFCQEMMLKNFEHDLDINDVEAVTDALDIAGQDAAKIIELATSAEHKGLLRESTQEAQAKGIFGAPTFLIGDEMFWGNDRLEDAIAFAKSV